MRDLDVVVCFWFSPLPGRFLMPIENHVTGTIKGLCFCERRAASWSLLVRVSKRPAEADRATREKPPAFVRRERLTAVPWPNGGKATLSQEHIHIFIPFQATDCLLRRDDGVSISGSIFLSINWILRTREVACLGDDSGLRAWTSSRISSSW